MHMRNVSTVCRYVSRHICTCMHLVLEIWVRGMTGCCSSKMVSQLWDGRTYLSYLVTSR